MTGLAAFALYGSGAAPGLLWADSGEMQGAAMTLGIPHATGYPTLILLGALAGKIGGLHAINLLSSLCGAVSLGMIVLVMGELGVGVPASVAAAVVFGLTFAPWRNALRAEVYSLANALSLVATWATLVAHRTDRWGVRLVAAFFLGLTVTGHLSFAPPVAVLGASLAWRTWQDSRLRFARLAILLGAFLLGFTPWLETLLADVRGAGINYFDLVNAVHGTDGRPVPGLETPLRRLVWLILGRNVYPPLPFAFSLRRTVVNAIEIVFDLFYFQLGPVALPFAIAGLVRLWRSVHSRAVVLIGALLASLLFCAFFSAGPMMHLFLLPAMITLALAIGAGLQALLDRPSLRGASGVLVAILVTLLMVAPGNALRKYADAHPLTHWRFRMTEEGTQVDRAWIPSLRHETEPERYGRLATTWIPRNALVMADWDDISVLRYFRAVRGARPDLVVQPEAWETGKERIRRWQRTHDLLLQPIVFSDRPPDSFQVTISESVQIVPGHSLYVSRTPIPDPGRP